MENPRRFRRSSPRVAVAAALAIGTVTVFAALGGVGVAQSASSAVQQYGEKVTICHKGKTITVSKNAVAAHVRNHGDTIGPCTSAAAKAKAAKVKAAKVKAAKVKAAKVKAAKAKAEKSQAEKPKTQKGEKPGKGKGRGK